MQFIEKQFQEMLKSMTEGKDWTLRSWKDSIGKQMNSWMMYIPGMSSSNDVKKLQEFKGMSLFLYMFPHLRCFALTIF